jgi:hypothetical protein
MVSPFSCTLAFPLLACLRLFCHQFHSIQFRWIMSIVPCIFVRVYRGKCRHYVCSNVDAIIRCTLQLPSVSCSGESVRLSDQLPLRPVACSFRYRDIPTDGPWLVRLGTLPFHPVWYIALLKDIGVGNQYASYLEGMLLEPLHD